MPEFYLFLLAFVAIGTGWLLAKFPFNKLYLYFRHRSWQRSYLQVLRLLLHEQTDSAIEDFIENWPVDSKTVELHNLLAIMLRRKGEVERAIRIHTSIVECRKLSKEQQLDATVELAYDYMSSGLLDRAERLLINLINNNISQDERILEILQSIYQTEQEWHKAIAVAEQLLPKKTIRLGADAFIVAKQANDIAHYYCEIAQHAMDEYCYSDATKAVDAALLSDNRCARANMIRAQLLLKRGEEQEAKKALDQVLLQDSHLLPECLDLLQDCYLGDEKAFLQHLKQWQQSYPSASIEGRIVELVARLDSEAQAKALQQYYLQRRPTLLGLRKLAAFELSASTSPTYNEQLFQLLDNIIQQKPFYRCKECGFSGMQLHWICPQCQQWDTVRRRRGSEGD